MTTTLPAPTTQPATATLTATHGRISDYAFAKEDPLILLARRVQRFTTHVGCPRNAAAVDKLRDENRDHAVEFLEELAEDIADVMTTNRHNLDAEELLLHRRRMVAHWGAEAVKKWLDIVAPE